MMNFDKFVNC